MAKIPYYSPLPQHVTLRSETRDEKKIDDLEVQLSTFAKREGTVKGGVWTPHRFFAPFIAFSQYSLLTLLKGTACTCTSLQTECIVCVQSVNSVQRHSTCVCLCALFRSVLFVFLSSIRLAFERLSNVRIFVSRILKTEESDKIEEARGIRTRHPKSPVETGRLLLARVKSK